MPGPQGPPAGPWSPGALRLCPAQDANGGQACRCPPRRQLGPLEPRRTSEAPRPPSGVESTHSSTYLQSSCREPGSLLGSEDGRWEQPECPRLWHQGGCHKRRNRESPKKYRKGDREIQILKFKRPSSNVLLHKGTFNCLCI